MLLTYIFTIYWKTSCSRTRRRFYPPSVCPCPSFCPPVLLSDNIRRRRPSFRPCFRRFPSLLYWIATTDGNGTKHAKNRLFDRFTAISQRQYIPPFSYIIYTKKTFSLLLSVSTFVMTSKKWLNGVHH